MKIKQLEKRMKP